jgi:MoaA/NifB/PqqE/SkfB family radical SAM enzyme
MCPRVSLSEEWRHGDMSIDTYRRIATHFPHCKVVYLSGWGEPLLHERILEMVRCAKKAGCSVGFTTNGTLLTEQVSQEIVKLKLDMIAISIDGATPRTYEAIRVGAKFDQVVANVRGLCKVKREAGNIKPEVVLTFLMMKENLKELPLVIDLAHKMELDRVVATNLDCVITPRDEALHVFSCNSPDPDVFDSIENAHATAERYRLPVYIYPVEMRYNVICTEDPLRNISFSWDGEVAPCVCVNMPSAQGAIPRVFCGRRYEVPCLSFGNVDEQDFYHIWNNQKYRDFRQYFSHRRHLHDLALSEMMLRDGFGGGGEFEEKRVKLQSTLRDIPLPYTCETCYKAYGV